MSSSQGPEPAGPPAEAQDPRPAAESPAAGWAWAKPAQPIRWVPTEPLEYHRLFRGVPRYRWWRPLLALLLGVVYYLTLSVVFGLLVMVPYLMISGAPLDQDALMELAIPDTQRPISLLLTLGSVAMMIPAVQLAMLSTGLSPVGRIWSVALRIRWGLIWRTALPALAALVVMNAIGFALEAALAAGRGGAAPPEAPVIDWGLAAWSAALILVLVPIQSAAEEMVFRGLLMQVIGSWLKSPWFAIVIPSVLFGFAHIYDVWGWLSVVAMALIAGWISWRTGGLEAAISLHVINNWVAFGFMTAGVGGATAQTESSGGLGSLIGTVVGLLLYAWWVDRGFRRSGGGRMRVDLVEDRGPAAGGAAVAVGSADAASPADPASSADPARSADFAERRDGPVPPEDREARA